MFQPLFWNMLSGNVWQFNHALNCYYENASWTMIHGENERRLLIDMLDRIVQLRVKDCFYGASDRHWFLSAKNAFRLFSDGYGTGGIGTFNSLQIGSHPSLGLKIINFSSETKVSYLILPRWESNLISVQSQLILILPGIFFLIWSIHSSYEILNSWRLDGTV